MSELHVAQLVCSAAFAGVERFVLTTARGLAARPGGGLRVTVIGGDPVVLPRELGPAVDWLPGGSRAEAWRSLRRLGRVDVLNTHMTDADVVGAFARHPRTAIVSTRHFAAPRGGNPVTRAVAGAAARRLTAEIAISDFVAASIETPAAVIHTGVADAPADSRSESAREPVVLVLQRLEAEKQTELAVRAWAASNGPACGWRLRVGGDGAERPALERLAAQLGVAGSVEFLGFVAAPADEFRRAGLLVAPTPREGLGLTVLEAMAHGLPVVAAAAGGHVETVGSVAGAALFPPGDVRAAAEAIDALIADQGRRAAYGAALRDRQRAEFSVAGQIAKTAALYREVAA
jgi:glycosyltransferase involved in cell wall biosynthesis